jgi:hypothetical protein
MSRVWDFADAQQDFAAAARKVSELHQQIAYARYMSDPLNGRGDALDRQRQAEMAAVAMLGAVKRLRLAEAEQSDAAFRIKKHRPKPMVRLNTPPARSRSSMSMTELTRTWTLQDWQEFARSKDRYEERNLGY